MVDGPNFIIGGAPKCGTTAMADYLRDHPSIFLSGIKEPFYWASDMPSMRSSQGVDTFEKYLDLFRYASSGETQIGEGSTLYLYSEPAIRDVLQWRPDMKFIFMLRRPAEIAHAYHMQMIFHEFEDTTSFPDAWAKCSERRSSGTPVAVRCRERKLLQYDAIASIGSQLKRAVDLIPAENRLVLLFDDFVADTKAAYTQACQFLGVEDDGRSEFAKTNSAMKSRNPTLTRMMRSPIVRDTTQFLKRHLSGSIYSWARTAKHSLMFRNTSRDPLGEDFNRQLHDFFIPEVELVEELLGRNLDSWKRPKISKKTA